MTQKQECPACTRECSVNKAGSLRKHHCVPEPTGPLADIAGEDLCEVCGVLVALDEFGVLVEHTRQGEQQLVTCEGSPSWDPESEAPAPFGDEPEPAPATFVVNAATASRPDNGAAMAFLSAGTRTGKNPRPSTVDAAAYLADGDGGEYLNASGQPRSKTNRYGYLITDPDTGEYRRFKNGNIQGFSRCTTVVKASSDNRSLSDWEKRNVLMGAVKRPDIAARAFGKTHEDDKAELDSVVDELETIAGAKIAADQGTEFHEITEQHDGGLLTLEQCPPFWRRLLEEYARVMDAYGFEPVPGLIERTTMTHEYGGVAGTGDRIHFHRPSQTYIVTDVKSGKGAIDYGRREIPAQLATYQKGYSTNGVYDWPKGLSWDTPQSQWPAGTWKKLDFPVRDDWGIVIHTPLQGAAAHTVQLYPAPLAYGREVVQQCYEIRRDRSAAPKFEPLDPSILGVYDWRPRFESVRTPEDASAAWNAARKAGVDRMELKSLVRRAQDRLTALGHPAR